MLVMRTVADASISARLRSVAKTRPKEVVKAIVAEARIELREAKKRTPWDTKALKKSGRVVVVDRNPKRIAVAITFGNEEVDYAVYVHENLEVHHPHGQAKFLESVLNESKPYMLRRILRRVNAGG